MTEKYCPGLEFRTFVFNKKKQRCTTDDTYSPKSQCSSEDLVIMFGPVYFYRCCRKCGKKKTAYCRAAGPAVTVVRPVRRCWAKVWSWAEVTCWTASIKLAENCSVTPVKTIWR